MSMRITTQMVDNTNLATINNDLEQLDATQETLSTGYQINQASDNPFGENQTLTLQAQISNYSSYTSNINQANGSLSAASTSLQSIQSVVNTMQELTTGAANGTMNQTDLNDDAQEVLQYISELKQTANTQYDGNYIFSGTATKTQPYNQSATGSDTFAGNTASINVAISPGTTVSASANLSAVLGNGVSGDGGLLSTMRAIYNDMTGTNGGTQADLSSQLTALESNLSSLEAVQAQVGATQDQLGMASTRIESLTEADTTQLGDVEDTNEAEATLKYSTEQSGYQAALQSTAQIIQQSLLNFLQS